MQQNWVTVEGCSNVGRVKVASSNMLIAMDFLISTFFVGES